MRYKVTFAQTYIVEADGKAGALAIAKNDAATQEDYFEGEYTSVYELPVEQAKGWTSVARNQLTGK